MSDYSPGQTFKAPRCLATSFCLALLVLIAAPQFAQEGPQGAAAGKESSQPERRAKKKLKRSEVERLVAQLPDKYQQWLFEVNFLISNEEKLAFLEIEQDYQRDAFIERFWRIRDPFPDSPRNEFRIQWYERLDYARQQFGDLLEDRSRMLLLNGLPNARIEFRCSVVKPLELWLFDGSDRVREEFFLVFYRRDSQRFVLWRPSEGLRDLISLGAENNPGANDFYGRLRGCRDGDLVAAALRQMSFAGQMNYEMLLARIERPRENASSEWLATFSAYSTDLPEEAGTFDATVSFSYPERYKSRTVVETRIDVPVAEAGVAELADHRGFNYFLTGEVLSGEELFENFRYKFDFPADGVAADVVPIVFQRRLRPGDYRVVLKLEDLNSKKFFRHVEDVSVPRVETAGRSLPEDPLSRRLLEEAETAIGTDIPTVQIVEPYGTMQTGMVRFDTLVTGEGIAEMRFALDGKVVLQKRRPPFSVELDLGSVPRLRRLRVSAHNEGGVELASDELTINAGQHSFSVRLVQPQSDVDYQGEVQAEADVLTPDGIFPERVELYLNEDLVATLYQPPYTYDIPLPASNQIAYVRAVAFLRDGNSTEDLVYINAPDYLENVDIEFVELYATALDKKGHPVLDLEADNFVVLEDGVQQTIARFERVTNLPIHAQVMIDVSASMKDDIEQTQLAALHFFEQMITPKDRACLVTFNDHPLLAVELTNDVTELAGGLAGLKAERGTALYDSIIFGLYYMNGLKGQKAVLLLSDGKDESSRFAFENTLEYARRSGVAIYAIGLNIRGKQSAQAKRRLTELADETGGRSFFIDNVDELASIYDTIQEELRSRYLIAYQSSNSSERQDFRTVDLEVSRDGVTAKSMRGYYP